MISGNPTALIGFTEATVPTFPPLLDATEAAGTAIQALTSAPSDIAITVSDWTPLVASMAGSMRDNDELAADFARALQIADANGLTSWNGSVTDERLFAAILDAVRSGDHSSDRAIHRAAMEQLAEDLADDFSDLIGDVDASREDIEDIQFALLSAINDIQGGLSYRDGPWPTDAEIVQEAFQRISGMVDSPLDADQLQRLSDLTRTLDRVSDDPAFAPAFLRELGPEQALAAAELAGYAAWSNELSGVTTVPSPRSTVRVLSETMATASRHGLGHDWLDELVDSAIDDGTLNDAFPLLFTHGQLSRAYAITVGEIGIDVLDGQREGVGDLSIDKGVGSPFFDGFDVAETSWRERGAFLLDAAARTPSAANHLVLEHGEALVAHDFADRDGALWVHHHTDYDAIGGALRNLIVAGTVTYAESNPLRAREAAAHIMNQAVDQGPGAAADALAPAYADIVVTYLADFGNAVPGTGHDFNVHDGELRGSLIDFARFTSLAMGDESGRDAILAQRESVITGLVILDQTVGLEIASGRTEAPLGNQIGSIDAILLAALNEHGLAVAEAEQSAAENRNRQADLFRDSFITLLPTSRIPAIGRPVATSLIRNLANDLLHVPTGQVSQAQRDLTEGTYDHLSSQRQLIVTGELAVAINQLGHIENHSGSGPAPDPLTERQQRLLDTARSELGDGYVESLLSHTDPTTPNQTIPPVNLQDLASWVEANADPGLDQVRDTTLGLQPLFPDALY